MSDDDLKDYLAKHPVPMVVGPNNQFFITDHHHMIAALLGANLKSTHHVVAQVTNNWAGEDRDQFFQKMLQSNLLWLYDDKGYAPMNPLTLPQRVLDLPNDPYRSLASLVQYAGGFLNDGTPFCQFQWANLFRKANLLPSQQVPQVQEADAPEFSWCNAYPYDTNCWDENSALKSALPKALAICNDASSSNMCGYGQGVKSQQKCGNTRIALGHVSELVGVDAVVPVLAEE